MCDKNNFEKKLVDDIIEMAKESVVCVLIYESAIAAGYGEEEFDNLDEYFLRCRLPESVKKYVMNNNLNYEFVEELIDIAEDREEVASFQFYIADDGGVIYEDGYRSMTSDYEMFKRSVGSELGAVAAGEEITELEVINSYKTVSIWGNDLGYKWFERYVAELEEESK